MKNKNLNQMIESLFDCANRENPKTPGLYDKPITISFDGLTCEIPFNILNYCTLLNALCEIENTFDEFSPQENELLFDLMAAEQLRFNLSQCLDYSDPPEIYTKNYEEYDQAREKRNMVEMKCKAILKIDPKKYWEIKEKIMDTF